MFYTNTYHNISRHLNRVQTFASFLYLLSGNNSEAKHFGHLGASDDGDDDDDDDIE